MSEPGLEAARLLTADHMKKIKADPQLKKRVKVSDAAIAKFDADIADINAGRLVSPSTDFQFVWEPTSGARFLFKGLADPLA